MRSFLVASLLLAALLAGCGGGSDGGSRYTSDLIQADIVVPAEATLAAIEGGFAAEWKAHDLPFSIEFPIPGKASLVRAVGTGATSGVSMVQDETGRRRCNNPTVEDFNSGFASPVSCSSITALDVDGTVWRANFGGAGQGDLRIEYLDVPYDGILAGLDFTDLDKPVRDLQPTVVEFLPSHDGALLRTERTLPVGDGPFPTIIVSSPYYDDGIRATPADWTYVVHDWAKRGFAMVTADVRGFGDSGGCVEVWGINEQLDQKFLVDWVAQQPWSDQNVGFYGQSYVGTTPVEAAVQAPEALKAIVTIAPVINAYEDWHYGGVPNGESELSPVSYQVLTDAVATDPTVLLDERYQADPRQAVNNVINGPCNPTLVVGANDPRALYSPFYEERNFKLRAKDVKAAVLYTEGFEDANVKAAMIPGWFNELQTPKLGLFGHWLHQHPSRLDCEALMVGWFETHLKGKDLGFDSLPAVAVQVNRTLQRSATEWPPTGDAVRLTNFAADLTAGSLTLGAPATGPSTTLVLDHAGVALASPLGANLLAFTGTLPMDVSLAGVAQVPFHGTLVGVNAYVAAYLYDGDRLVTWGQLNLAHNADHTMYTPNVPPADMERSIPLRPTEHVFAAGSQVTLQLRGVQAAEATDPFGILAGYLNVDRVGLDLPGVLLGEYEPLALTATP